MIKRSKKTGRKHGSIVGEVGEAGEARYGPKATEEEAQNSEENEDSKWAVVGLLVGMGKETIGSVRGREMVTFPNYPGSYRWNLKSSNRRTDQPQTVSTQYFYSYLHHCIQLDCFSRERDDVR